jgi:hypothetical protein
MSPLCAKAGHAPFRVPGRDMPAASGWTCPLRPAAIGHIATLSAPCTQEWTCAVDGPGRACQAPGNGHVLSCAPRRACRSLTSPHALPLPQPSDISPSCPRPPARNGHVRRTGQAGHVRHPEMDMSSPASGQVLPSLQPLDTCPICPPTVARNGHVPWTGASSSGGTQAAQRCPCRLRC